MSKEISSSQALDLFYKQCFQLADRIDAARSELHQLLGPYQTWEVMEHEIEFSIEALKNIPVEYDGFKQPDNKVTASCFIPMNMPLYSLILYAVLPSYYFESIYIRPGASLSQFMKPLVKILDLKNIGFKQVKIRDLPVKLFIDLYAKDSDVILFTGKYENALVLEKECPESMLIFEGTGPCPFFVFDNADVELAAEKAIAMRCFNSGQDCVAPDVIFVPKNRLEDFSKSLIQRLRQVKVGDSRDQAVRVAHMVKEKYLFSVEQWLETNREHIVYGGEVDTKQLIIKPTVLSLDIAEHTGDFKELFSPVFYILSYDDNQSLLEIINSESFKRRSMYAIIFGDDKSITSNLSLCTILNNETVNDQENGNEPYGGYGPIANFISYKGNRQARPLLISRDIREWLLSEDHSKLPEHAF